MRLIGTLPTEIDAKRLGDYLLSIGLRNHIEPASSGEWMLWIEHDDHIDQAHSQLNAYRASPTDPRYDAARPNAEAVRKNEEVTAKKRRDRFVDVRTSWSGVRVRPTPVTFGIVGLCVILAGLTMMGATRDGPSELGMRVGEALHFQSFAGLSAYLNQETYPLGRLGMMFSTIFSGQFWRLITPAFMHGDILHLLFNMMWVLTIARLIEARKGSVFLIMIVLASAIFSNVGEALWTVYGPGRDGYARFLGFSGVNYALFGYAWMKGRFQPYEGIGVNQQTIGLLLTWLVLCMTGLMGPVANAAHVAGLVIGVAIGYWPTWRRRMVPPRLNLRD
jgi:GlpG protein